MRKLPLFQLISDFPDIERTEAMEKITIKGISCDSRNIKKDYVFVAIQGDASDGSRFIPQAMDAGATVIVISPEANVSLPDNVIVIEHVNPRLVLSKMAARFYDLQPPTIIAVTGTNGKTSTTHFCMELWNHLGHKSASVGTIGIRDSQGKIDFDRENFLTTPDPVKFHQILSLLVERGVTHVSIEASSHGLSQYRLDGVNLSAAAFTNLSRDHLDYHGSFQAYLEAKARLFSELMNNGKPAIINADIPQYDELKALCKEKMLTMLTYGKSPGDFHILDIKPDANGQKVQFEYEGKKYKFHTPLVGSFQAYNLLCALAIVVGLGEDIEKCVKILPNVHAVPGRMELVNHQEKGPKIFVDYSHTPDALEKALKELRIHTKGKLCVVFGCGGNRDQGKRHLMGNVAADFADEVIITDDNPRHEDPATIRGEILSACPEATEIGSRKKAIETAISGLKINDTLLIAGKGHEKYQIVGDRMLSFDDVAVAKAMLA